MSIEFSDESLYVARNWQTITEIIRATQRLRSEMERMMASLESDLRSMEWWSIDWAFVVRDPGQVYISRECWRSGEQYLVWIGVDRFRPENVFGLDDPPELYVWVSGKRYDLAAALADSLEGRDLPGEVDMKASSGCVVRQAVAKCLPDGVETYFPQAREQTIAFLKHYAGLADVWAPIVWRHIE